MVALPAAGDWAGLQARWVRASEEGGAAGAAAGAEMVVVVLEVVLMAE